MAKAPLDDDTLDGFRRAQQLAYRCAETVAAELEPGISERETAARMQAWLVAHGATECFHRPLSLIHI